MPIILEYYEYLKDANLDFATSIAGLLTFSLTKMASLFTVDKLGVNGL